jgi:cell division transport system permease protein
MSLLKRIKSAWALESFRPDVPLSRDEASRFLPWIIALMVYLTALTLAGSFTLHRTVTAGHAAQIESFSVHLPHTTEASKDIADKALALVRNTPGVSEAEIISTGRIREMVEPWLGKSEALNNLPLPLIIEAKIASGADIDYALLKAHLQGIAPGAEIDDHRQWIAQFSAFVHMVQWILFIIAAMIMTASAAAVIFACKTSLKIHRGTVSLLHRLGAYDGYIANQFQKHAALLALKGAFVGSGLAAGTMLVLHLMARHIDSPLFPSFTLNLNHWVILLSLPVLMSIIALASARVSVLDALQRMP